jgi:hypothetical protein
MKDEATHDIPAPTPACPICHRLDPNGRSWACCVGCVQRTDRMLVDILEAHALASLPEYLIPSRSGDGAGPVSGSHERPIGLDVAVLDLALGEDQLAVLEQWERWWREHWGLSPYGEASGSRLIVHVSHGTYELASTPTSRNLTGTVGFLRAWWPTASGVNEPPPEEFASEVRHLHGRALTALRMTEPKPTTIACPADLDNGSICGHRIPLTGDGNDLYCTRCGTRWTTARLLLVAAVSGARVEISVEDAAHHYGVTTRTVRRMIERGELRRASYGRVIVGTAREVTA